MFVFISYQKTFVCLYNSVLYNLKVYKCFFVSHRRHILVLTESLISGHQLVRIRERLADKLEFIYYDPLGKWPFMPLAK